MEEKQDLDFSKVTNVVSGSALKPNHSFEEDIDPIPVKKENIEQAVKTIEKKDQNIERKKVPVKHEQPKEDNGQIQMF